MGDGFAGHSASGLAFLLLGNWFAINTCLLWWRSQSGGREFVTRVSYQQGWRLPWESIVKIVITLGYALGEFLTGWWAEYTFLLHGQHITMCGFFLINGIVDILIFKKVSIPKDVQFLTASLAFLAESFLFTNHSHGKNAVHQMTHHLLYLPSYVAAGVLLVEAVLPTVWLLPSIRNLAISTHGSWLVQSAFILYPERVGLAQWEEDNTMMLLPMLFSWHLLGNLLLHLAWLLITKGLAGSTGDKATYSRLLETVSEGEEDEGQESDVV